MFLRHMARAFGGRSCMRVLYMEHRSLGIGRAISPLEIICVYRLFIVISIHAGILNIVRN